MKYNTYIQSKHWLQTRIDILTNRPKCERCGSKHKLQVHHLTYKNIYNENPEDLEVLCAKCHMQEHGLIKVKKSFNRKKLTPEQKAQKRIKRLKEKAIRKANSKRKYGT